MTAERVISVRIVAGTTDVPVKTVLVVYDALMLTVEKAPPVIGIVIRLNSRSGMVVVVVS